MTSEPRSTEQRTRDVLALFEYEKDAWVASASENGKVHLIPLSFHWTGRVFLMAFPVRSVTSRNLKRAEWARIAIGPTRDVAIVEGPVEVTSPPDNDPVWDEHAASCGFDARQSDEDFTLVILTPEQIQTWRNPAELANRQVMRHGNWVASET